MTEKLETESELRARLEKVCSLLRCVGLSGVILSSRSAMSVRVGAICSHEIEYTPDVIMPKDMSRVLVRDSSNARTHLFVMDSCSRAGVMRCFESIQYWESWLDLETGNSHNWKPEWTPENSRIFGLRKVANDAKTNRI